MIIDTHALRVYAGLFKILVMRTSHVRDLIPYNIIVDINLKPWKRKVNTVRSMIDGTKPVFPQVQEIIERIRSEGQHKRRTVVSYSINENIQIKL